MKPTVYLETTIPSYLTAWPSRDLVRAGHQQITRDFWEKRTEYELRVSYLVVQECGCGDPDAAAERLKAIEDIPVLEGSGQAESLASRLIRDVKLPP